MNSPNPNGLGSPPQSLSVSLSGKTTPSKSGSETGSNPVTGPKRPNAMPHTAGEPPPPLASLVSKSNTHSMVDGRKGK